MYQELSILQASQKWPTSTAHTFQLKDQNPNVLYFRIEDPEFVNTNGIRSRVKCLKFNKVDGYLVITNVPIKVDAEIEVLTIKDFADAVLIKVKELQTQGDLEKLIPYEHFGFLG